MPATQDPKTKKWRVGKGPAIYPTKEKALRAMRAIYARRNRERKNKRR